MAQKNKQQKNKNILATVVMGMNLVNTMAPAAALAAAPQQQPLPQPPQQQQTQCYDYELLPTLAGYVDDAVFGRAEAAVTTNGSQAVLNSGDVQHVVSKSDSDKTGTAGIVNSGGRQNISSGGVGTVETMSSGFQEISSGGTGTVSTMNRGWQNIYSGGVGTVETMNSGGQEIASGSGMVSTMSGGQQTISSGGTGTIDTMANGKQMVTSGGTGTIDTMSSGKQLVYGGIGTVSAMNDGIQDIFSGGSGTISTMNGGEQTVNSGGYGAALGILGGTQYISAGGTGYVEGYTANQVISSGGTGIVETVKDGDSWTLTRGQTGIANKMSGGTQTVSSGAVGTVSTMSGGSQIISGSGTGTVDTMSGGWQYISGGGTGTVNNMSGGSQSISSGAGTVNTMNGGTQAVASGGTGTVSTMSGGTQAVASGGTGTVSTMSGGTQYISGGEGTIDTMANGTQEISSGGTGTVSSMNGGTQAVLDSGKAISTTINGGNQDIASGGTAVDTNIKGGMQTVSSGGTANATVVSGGVQYIQNGAVISGTEVQTDGVLRLAQDGDSAFALTNALTINGGTIDMTDGAAATALGRSVRAGATPTYQSLTVSDLQGSGGKLLMDTDLAGGTGDTLTVGSSNNGTGSYGISVRDLSSINGTEVTGAHKLLLVTDNSGKLTFTGEKANFGGLWDVDPTLEQDGSLWYLTKLAKTVNNDTAVLLDAADNSYALWRNTNDSLRGRLGALASGSEQSDGVWARTQAGRFSGTGYEGRYNMYQFGYDKAANANSIYGAAVDYGDGTGSYADGSGKDKLKTLSLYGVWTGDSGAYTNVTARYGIVSTDLESYGDFPDKAAYKEHAYSVSVEYGKRLDLESGLFFEPNAQFTLGRLGGISYTTDRGANGHIDGMNSAIGRIGFVLGQKVIGGSDIYLKADLLHEFAGERDLQLTSDAGGTNDILNKHNDYGDTWFELGLGGNVKISKAGNFYGEVTRGFGGDINKKWSINAGLRFEF